LSETTLRNEKEGHIHGLFCILPFVLFRLWEDLGRGVLADRTEFRILGDWETG
jgi:hypothetical protein